MATSIGSVCPVRFVDRPAPKSASLASITASVTRDAPPDDSCPPADSPKCLGLPTQRSHVRPARRGRRTQAHALEEPHSRTGEIEVFEVQPLNFEHPSVVVRGNA